MTKISKNVYINLSQVNSITIKYIENQVFYAFTLVGNTYHPSQYFTLEKGEIWIKKIMEKIDESK